MPSAKEAEVTFKVKDISQGMLASIIKKKINALVFEDTEIQKLLGEWNRANKKSLKPNISVYIGDEDREDEDDYDY